VTRIAAAIPDLDGRIILGPDTPAPELPPGWAIARDIPPTEVSAAMSRARAGRIAGGRMMYEAASRGLPCVVIPQNEMQGPGARAFDALGVHVVLGIEPDDLAIADAIGDTLDNESRRRKRATTGREVVDGLGGQRVAQTIAELMA
jgi:UDP:flavonoid glycosyltransferase YjiC (YdhE family)